MPRWEELFTDWNRAMDQGIGLGRILSDIAVEHAKLEAVVEAARKIFDVEGDYVGDCNCTSCKKITGDFEEALKAL